MNEKASLAALRQRFLALLGFAPDIEQEKLADGTAPNAKAGGKGRELPSEILRFQPDSVLLERAKPPLGARWSLYALAAFVVITLLWSIFGRIDRIVTAEGKIVTVDTPVVLQTYSISIVKEIRCAMGQRVNKGDVLVVLDPTFAQADVTQLQDRIASLAAHVARLQSETEGRDYVPDLKAPGLSEADVRELRLQMGIFASRKVEYSSRLKTYEEQTKRLTAERASTAADLGHRRERLKIYHEIEGMHQRLYKQGIEARAGYLDVEKDRHTVEGDVLRMESTLQELEHELSSVEADRAAYISSWRSQTAQELVTTRRQLDESREAMNKAKKLGELVDIRAPMDAVVLEVAKRNVGSVADETETLVTLVPLDAKLEVEVEIKPEDIAYVRVGQTARVKLSALPFQKHGKMDATVQAVSEDAFLKKLPQGEMSVYRSRLQLPANPLAEMRNLPAGFALLPGMTVTGEINIGDRRIIEYFLYPIIAGFDQSLKEPR